MKATILILFLCACIVRADNPKSSPEKLFAIGDRSECYSNFLAAIADEPNREKILAKFNALENERIVRMLARDTVKELQRKLDTLERHTNSHPYTKEQLEAAIKRRTGD